MSELGMIMNKGSCRAHIGIFQLYHLLLNCIIGGSLINDMKTKKIGLRGIIASTHGICETGGHYHDVIMSAMASQIMSLMIVYSILFRRRLKKIWKPRVTGFCVGNSTVTSGFPAQRTSNAENISFNDVIMFCIQYVAWYDKGLG